MTLNFWRTAVGVAFISLVSAVSPTFAQSAPSLGAAQGFAVLAGSAVTSTGSTVVTGDLGVSPGTAATGFPPGLVVAGTIHAADAVALAAQGGVTTAYNALASESCTQDLTGQDLGGLTLTPGVYCFSSSAQLTGTLTLNALGNSDAVFIFKTGSTLTTASASSVVVINGGPLCNVFWQIGSSATLGTNSTFVGNILALTSITVTTGAQVSGRTLARTGAVTLDSNAITVTCGAGTVCPAISLTPPTLPNGTVAVAYSQAIVGSGGTAPYTYAVDAGSLPVGLVLSTAGALTGTPRTAAAQVTFAIRGTDANGCFAVLPYSMTVLAAPEPPAGCPAITLTPPTLPDGTVSVAYSQTIAGNGGTAPYRFGVTAGTLPPGMTLTGEGLLSGTPTDAGHYNVTIRGTDANGCFAEVPYTMAVVTAVPTLPQAFALLLAMSLAAAGYLRLRRGLATSDK